MRRERGKWGKKRRLFLSPLFLGLGRTKKKNKKENLSFPIFSLEVVGGGGDFPNKTYEGIPFSFYLIEKNEKNEKSKRMIFLVMDILVLVMMKNAAKCDNYQELQFL